MCSSLQALLPFRCTGGMPSHQNVSCFPSIFCLMTLLFAVIHIAGDTVSTFGLGFSLSVTPPLNATSSSAKRDNNMQLAISVRDPRSLARSGPTMSPQPVNTGVQRGPSPCLIWSGFAASRMMATWPFLVLGNQGHGKMGGTLSKPSFPVLQQYHLETCQKTRNPFQHKTSSSVFSLSVCCRAH